MSAQGSTAQLSVASQSAPDSPRIGTRHKFDTADGPLWTFGRIEPTHRQHDTARHYEHYRYDVRLQPSRRIGVRWGLGFVGAARSEWRGASSFRGVNYDWTGDSLELLIGTRVLRVRRCWATVTER